MSVNFLLLLIVLTVHLTAQATPQSTTFQARIIKPDGNYLEDANVPFRFTILAPVANCILSVEDFGVYSMAGSRGTVAISLGKGSAVFIAAPATNFSEVFNNFPSSAYNCQGGGTYMPTANDSRRVTPQFYALGQWNTLPTIAVNSVPYANYAGLAAKLTGLPNCNPATEALSYNGTTFTCLVIGSGGITALTGDITASGTGSVATTIAANAVTTAKINDGAITASKLSSMDATTAGQVMKWNGTAWVASSDISGVGSETDPFVSSWAKAASLDLTASASLNGALPVANGGTGAATAANNYVFAGPTSGGPSAPSFRALASSDIPSLSGSYLTKAGVAGGQTAAGGTAASESLTLDSTTNATKGNIILNPTGGNVGIGTTTPSVPLEINRSSPGTVTSSGVTVTGTGTTFLSTFKVGDLFYARNQVNTIASIVSDTSLTTSSAFSPVLDGISYARSQAKFNGVVEIQADGQSATGGSTNGQDLLVLRNAYTPHGWSVGAALKFEGENGSFLGRIGTQWDANNNNSNMTLSVSGGDAMVIRFNRQVGIGTSSPAAGALLDITSTSLGFLMPRMTTAQRNAIVTPAAGVQVYNTSTSSVDFYNGSAWLALASTSGGGSFTNVTSITGSGDLTVSAGAGNQNLILAGSGTGAVTTASPLTITNATGSTSSATGAAVITGGLGVGGDIYAGASVNAGSSVTAATSVISPQIYGSTVASGDIKIDGTSNAAKGNVLLATAGGNVGIGTTAPTVALDIIGAGKHTISAIGTTSTDGLVLTNSTAATVGTQQNSPRLRFHGDLWNTTTPANKMIDVIFEVLGQTGSDNNDNDVFRIAHSVSGGAYSSTLSFSQYGNMTIPGRLNTSSVTSAIYNTGTTGGNGFFANAASYASVGMPVHMSPSLSLQSNAWDTTALTSKTSNWTIRISLYREVRFRVFFILETASMEPPLLFRW